MEPEIPFNSFRFEADNIDEIRSQVQTVLVIEDFQAVETQRVQVKQAGQL